jgi:pimeloyl-ACP methyl ester carboxylesterase
MSPIRVLRNVRAMPRGSSAHPTQQGEPLATPTWGSPDQASRKRRSAKLHLKRPVLVGWSLGGVVVTNYLSIYGDSHLAGVVYVDGVIEVQPNLLISYSAASAAIASDDLQQRLPGTHEFLEQCFFQKLVQERFELHYANAALASPEMSRVIGQVSVPAEVELPPMTKLVLLIYVERDGLVRQSATLSLAGKLMLHAAARRGACSICRVTRAVQ